MKKLEVTGIENGTVIDHVPAEKAFLVAKILKLYASDSKVVVGTNFSSDNVGNKGFIKIADRVLTQNETNKIGLIAPDATVNIIKNYEVLEKRKISVPSVINGIIACFNPNCITNKEEVNTVFSTGEEGFHCKYCERVMKSENIRIKDNY